LNRPENNSEVYLDLVTNIDEFIEQLKEAREVAVDLATTLEEIQGIKEDLGIDKDLINLE